MRRERSHTPRRHSYSSRYRSAPKQGPEEFYLYLNITFTFLRLHYKCNPFFGDFLIYIRNIEKIPRKFPNFDRLTPVLTLKHCKCFKRIYALRFADNAPESETRTAARMRVRRIVTRARIRHAAIRTRAVTGARQNKGIARCLIIVI